MYSDIIYEKGSARVNEDIATITEYGAWVLDGATGLNGKNFVDEISDTKWYVNWWNNYLSTNITSDESLKHIVKNGIKMVRNDFIKLSGINQFKEIDMPSSSIAIVKFNKDKTSAEYLNLGDCALVFNKDNNNTILFDQKLEDLDNEVLNQIHYLTEHEGLTLEQVKVKLKNKIVANRELKNKPNGYYILGFDEIAADKALYGKLDIDNNIKIFMASDGFTALYEKYHYITLNNLINEIEKKGIESFYSILRSIENNDSNANLYPRFKIHDDASAIFIRP